jgi:wyosine [tRNA(Phe)-imidazoG37] synthetase (radical SAM superfamily)
MLKFIERIQAENKKLKKKNLQLKEAIKKHEQEIERIAREYKHLKKSSVNSSLLIEKEKEIKNKIEGMLAKLESLENIPPI